MRPVAAKLNHPPTNARPGQRLREPGDRRSMTSAMIGTATIYDHAVWTIPKGVMLAAAAAHTRHGDEGDPVAKPSPIKRWAVATPLPRIIALDGPAGAGKSTVGRLLAARL